MAVTIADGIAAVSTNEYMQMLSERQLLIVGAITGIAGLYNYPALDT